MINKIVFSSLAQREIEFYVGCAKTLKAGGFRGEIHFISFCEPANYLVERAGFPLINAYERLDQLGTVESVESVEREFRIDNMRRLLAHELVTFAEKDTSVLLDKFSRYLRVSDDALTKIIGDTPVDEVLVFQELGGFIASLAPYFAAKRRSVRHIFFEPSFYRGRIVPVINSLMAVRPQPLASSAKIDHDCLEYLNSAKQKRTVVIPTKDQHHFHDMGLGKIFNRRNLNRLTEKLRQKYVTNERHEFDHVAAHTRRSFEMLMNRKKRDSLYTDFASVKQPYVYFPLHVERDYSLTIRSTPYYDQLSLLRLVSRILPPNVLILAKEHPASIGGFDQTQVEQLCGNEFDNFRLIHPSVNSYEILANASCILTINSKVGAEALLLEKPVIAMGDAFYTDSPLVFRADSLDRLETILTDVLKQRLLPDFSKFDSFFGAVWETSFAGELYVNTPENIATFCLGLEHLISTSRQNGIPHFPTTELSQSSATNSPKNSSEKTKHDPKSATAPSK